MSLFESAIDVAWLGTAAARREATLHPGRATGRGLAVACVPMELEMASGQDDELATLFCDLRRALNEPQEIVALRLGTTIAVIDALERGAMLALPPWEETSRVVIDYAELLGLDARPILRRIHAHQVANQAEPNAPWPDPTTPVPPPTQSEDGSSGLEPPRVGFVEDVPEKSPPAWLDKRAAGHEEAPPSEATPPPDVAQESVGLRRQSSREPRSFAAIGDRLRAVRAGSRAAVLRVAGVVGVVVVIWLVAANSDRIVNGLPEPVRAMFGDAGDEPASDDPRSRKADRLPSRY